MQIKLTNMLINKFERCKKLSGFTLFELMIVLTIIGALIVLAMPIFLPLITRAKSLEAKIQLKHLSQLQKTYFYTYSRYSSDFNELGFEQSKLVNNGGTANYKIEIVTATNYSFKLQATSLTDFDGDGVFNVWEINNEDQLKEVTPD